MTSRLQNELSPDTNTNQSSIDSNFLELYYSMGTSSGSISHSSNSTSFDDRRVLGKDRVYAFVSTPSILNITALFRCFQLQLALFGTRMHGLVGTLGAGQLAQFLNLVSSCSDDHVRAQGLNRPVQRQNSALPPEPRRHSMTGVMSSFAGVTTSLVVDKFPMLE